MRVQNPLDTTSKNTKKNLKNTKEPNKGIKNERIVVPDRQKK